MKPATSPLGIFERYLSVWVALAIAAGVGLGNLLPGLFSTISRLEYANVNFAHPHTALAGQPPCDRRDG